MNHEEIIRPASGDHCIVNTRVFNCSKAQLFEAWKNPVYLKQWWGPNGFTNTFHVFDFRIGGRWKFTMHGPEKGHYENEVEFVLINEARCILWKRLTKPLFSIKADFVELDAQRCELFFTMIFDTPEECEKLRPYVVDKNEENFDRLERVLGWMGEKMQGDKLG